MNILVCVKQVPKAEDVRLDPETNTLCREGAEAIINPYDLFALEAAVSLREEHSGTVTVISMGPPQADEVLRESLARGADKGYLICDRAFAGSDTLATTYTLARAIEKIGGVDLILCGKLAIDGDTAQVGPELAAWLNIPHVAAVRSIKSSADGKLTAERTMDDGYEEVEVELPFLFTVDKEINKPRFPSLKGKMKAKKAEIPVLNSEDIDAESSCLGLQGSPTWVSGICAPDRPGSGGKMIEGPSDRQAEELAEILSPII